MATPRNNRRRARIRLPTPASRRFGVKPNCADATRDSSPAKGELITRVAADLTKREVLNSVITSPGSTRASISQQTGLAASTVGHIIASLIAEGSITEYKQKKGPGSGSGRPAKMLIAVRTPRKGATTASIDFGHSHVGVALGDQFGRLGACRRIDFDVAADANRALDLAADALAVLRRSMDVGRPTVVVCGIPAPVDARTGTISSPSILPGWTGIRPSDELQRRLDATVRTETDTLLGALGELRAGAGRTRRDFLYINASGGIGASLVLNGPWLRRKTAGAGPQPPCRSVITRVWCLHLVVRVVLAPRGYESAGGSAVGGGAQNPLLHARWAASLARKQAPSKWPPYRQRVRRLVLVNRSDR